MKNTACKKSFYSIVSIVLTIICLAGCGKLASADSTSLPSSVSLPKVSQSEASIPEPKPEPRRVVDFTELQQQNTDIVAWIEVPGTVIDYPVMSTTDNSFYLNHDETKAYSKCGAIFMDMGNPVDFSYPVTVVYGHYTPDETHFTQLHKYEDPEYFAANPELYVYLPGVEQSYEIVAALLIGDENILYNKDYTDTTTMKEFLVWLKDTKDPKANLNLDKAGPNDHYLVLSTCTQSKYWSDQRYVVVARLVETIS